MAHRDQDQEIPQALQLLVVEQGWIDFQQTHPHSLETLLREKLYSCCALAILSQ